MVSVGPLLLNIGCKDSQHKNIGTKLKNMPNTFGIHFSLERGEEREERGRKM